MKFDDELTTLQNESLERFKILSKLRHSNYATKTNFFKTLYLSEDTWVYYKNNGEDFIIVALNRSTEKTINLDLSLLNLQASELTNIFNNQKFQISNGILNITIPEMESMVLK
jgi:hypothetical protein